MRTNLHKQKCFFEKLKDKKNDDSVTFIKNLISSSPPTYENDWLDFKGAEKIHDKDVNELWRKALLTIFSRHGKQTPAVILTVDSILMR